MNTPTITDSPERVAAGCAPATGSAAGEELTDGTQILHDESTTSTRWVLYRHSKTKTLNLAIVQGREKVSVSVKNLRYMLEVVVPEHEPPNS